jgi:divalent metal cation (Fe/Co/Zn/Cd) transporter
LVFSALVFAQWTRRRRAHQLSWGVGLLMYAVAAMMEAGSEFSGHWVPGVYRVYIVLAASLVGFLGLGTYQLLARRPTGPRVYLVLLLVGVAVFLFGTETARLDYSKLVPGITVGGQALGNAVSFPRVMSLPFNIVGTLFLLGGAVVSIWRFARTRRYAYRMWANVLIALGTIVMAAAGGIARAGETVGLYPAEMIASAILLAGFLLAGTLEQGSRRANNQARLERRVES